MYIDPGAGSLAFQLILSAIVGAGFTFRRAISRLFGSGRSTRQADEERRPDDESEP
jgi:hypothetical protein